MAARVTWRGWFPRLTALLESELTTVERAEAGQLSGQLGDPRSGVTLWADGGPDIGWIEIRPGPFLMGGKAGWQEGRQFECGVIQQPYRTSRYPITVAPISGIRRCEKGYEEERFWTKAGWKWRTSEKIAGPEDYDPGLSDF